MYNVGGQIGGDSDLSPQGWKYAQALPALIKENVGEDANLEASCRHQDDPMAN
jgi:6-phosphofructo-2-kinase/fructose-2,6-biphosphatase 2